MKSNTTVDVLSVLLRLWANFAEHRPLLGCLIAIMTVLVPEGKSELNQPSSHLGRVTAVEFCPYADLLASADTTGSVKLWNVLDGTLMKRLAPRGEVSLSLAVASDGERLSTGTLDHLIRVWDRTERRLLWTLTGHTGPVSAVAFTPEGSHVVSASEDSTLAVWNVRTGRAVHRWKAQEGALKAVAISPRGDLIATGGLGQKATIWHLARGDTVYSETGYIEDIRALAFSPDGGLLASSGLNRIGEPIAQIWHVQSGLPLSTVVGHSAPIGTIAFSDQGDRFAVGSEDGAVTVWDIQRSASGLVELELLFEASPRIGSVRSVLFSADGTQLMVAGEDGTIETWSVKNGSPGSRVRWRRHCLGAVVRMPGDSGLASAGCTAPDSSVIQFGDPEDVFPKEQWSLDPLPLVSLRFSPDRAWLAGGSASGLHIWEVSTGLLRHSLLLDREVRDLAYSPDGRYLMAASKGGAVILLTANGTKVRRILQEKEGLQRVWFEDSGRTLIREDVSGRQEFWRWVDEDLVPVANGVAHEPSERVPVPDEQKEILAVSDDGNWIATSDSKNSLWVSKLSDTSAQRFLSDQSTVHLILSATPAEIFRLDNAPLGSLRLTAGPECGDSFNTRCITPEFYVFVRFETEGHFLTLHTEDASISEVGLKAREIQNWAPDVLAIRIPGGLDLAKGDQLEVSGLRVSVSPRIFGESRHYEWRFNRETGKWERKDFVLFIQEHPELDAQIRISVTAAPASDVRWTLGETSVGNPMGLD